MDINTSVKMQKIAKKSGKKKLEKIIEHQDDRDRDKNLCVLHNSLESNNLAYDKDKHETELIEDDDSDDSSSRKRRGRKPKDKFKIDTMEMLEGQNKELEENIIVKLPLSCLQLSNEIMLNDGISYNPTLTIPVPYDKTNGNLCDIDGNCVTSGNSIDEKIASTSGMFKDSKIPNLCAKCNTLISDINGVDSSNGKCSDNTRQIDIILNNKYGCNSDKIQVLAQICSSVLENKWPSSVDIACYRCCHTFSNTPWGIPIKYVNGKFYLTGIFCTPNCVLGYILNESRADETQWEKIALLHMLYYQVFGTYINIMPSPDKICLQMFGGSTDIVSYRSITNENYKSYTVEFPPCNTIIPMLEEIYKKNNLFSSFLPNEKLSDKLGDKLKTTNGKVLKLKRFTPIGNTRNSLAQY